MNMRWELPVVKLHVVLLENADDLVHAILEVVEDALTSEGVHLVQSHRQLSLVALQHTVEGLQSLFELILHLDETCHLLHISLRLL